MSDWNEADSPIKVSNVIVTIVGEPDSGKSSLPWSAPGCALLNVDNSIHRSAYRAAKRDVLTWTDLKAVHDDPRVKEAPVVAVDTIGRVVDACVAAVVAENAKGTVFQGAPSQQGWGVVKSRMMPWIHRFQGKDIVLLCHSREEKKREDLIVRPDITGGTLQEVLKVSDMIGYLTVSGKTRTLDFEHTGDRLVKNSAQLPPMTVPDFSKGRSTFLADLLASVKSALSQQTEESAKAESQIADYRAQFDTFTTPEEFNRALEVLLSPVVPDGAVKAQAKTMLNNRAKAVGIQYNKATKAFEKAA